MEKIIVGGVNSAGTQQPVHIHMKNNAISLDPFANGAYVTPTASDTAVTLARFAAVCNSGGEMLGIRMTAGTLSDNDASVRLENCTNIIARGVDSTLKVNLDQPTSDIFVVGVATAAKLGGSAMAFNTASNAESYFRHIKFATPINKLEVRVSKVFSLDTTANVVVAGYV